MNAHGYASQVGQTIRSVSVNQLILSNFRNYTLLKLDLPNTPIVLTGKNGSGKTNILEAVSLLSPGRGVRGAKLHMMIRQSSTEISSWAISSKILQGDDDYHIGTAIDASQGRRKRLIKIDHEPIKNQTMLTKIFSVMWVTPFMDGLFTGGTIERRKFMDRLVYNFDPEHASRVYSYEHSMRERMKLLQRGGDDPVWINILEEKMAGHAIAITAARGEAMTIIQDAIMSAPTKFPKATITIEGNLETQFQCRSAIDVELWYKEQLRKSREEDKLSGRTKFGPHRSDLLVYHNDKNMPAALCSTGEQKALLLSIILAEARAKSAWYNSVPVLLLDEVVAHLDKVRSASLFDEIIALRAQAWLTGTDDDNFAALQGNAEFLHVDNGKVS